MIYPLLKCLYFAIKYIAYVRLRGSESEPAFGQVFCAFLAYVTRVLAWRLGKEA